MLVHHSRNGQYSMLELGQQAESTDKAKQTKQRQQEKTEINLFGHESPPKQLKSPVSPRQL